MNKQERYLILTLIFSAFIVAHAVFSLSHNFLLKNNFPNDPDAYDYRTDITDGSIDLRSVQMLFSGAVSLIDLVGTDDITNVMNTPVTMRYYNAIEDDAPVHTIEKGTAIVIKENVDHSFMPYPESVGYGLDSLPTDVNGWRLGEPFRTSVEDADDNLYYIKRDDLLAVSRAWVNENKGLVQLGKHMGLSKKTIEQLTLQVDQQLYDHGIYLSPVLFKPIFPMSSVFFLAFTILSFMTWRFFAKRS